MLRNYFFKDVKNTLNYDRKASLKSLIIFRLIVFIYMNYVMTYNFVTSVTYTNMFVYMTIWGATFSYLYFFFTIVENISYLLNDRKYIHYLYYKF